VDASAGKIGSPIDHVLLFCYHYDPTAAVYSASILKLIRLAGVLTILCIVGGILISRRRETRVAARNLRQPLPGGLQRGAH
jgi:protein SCO1/2